ncbi:hypothetical protein A3C34_03170 [Candidatus Amesbacteria bacterium RIFCSPHIGHO2_02_FULL_48_21]|uniref:Glycosyltransferase 2-like domain-containing protein n=4 Tax=Candidatus Amesiibacteriota TaxID=1752730 RepID=A0A1F4Z901_9BACT|nr:MAG: hypothetical protein UX78_C0003G0073 [Candidatus Amesbacteria bacterium GW2011_GWA2_47_11]KKU94754.1 MAG: hypothetical protein UY22_C0007G0018 [Candidatus Amesbacteria bacterium GW2011_GWC1_48_10]KKW01176.1 MAG: hypothetical protein UY33_C0001G0063 [Candidatus Amesbacteria bacterium GW2011_GWA1_48_9]OGC95402.1 MAG: hypothetical protein A3C34_03170 [Candidatus Amesbacteria bacterium RIFCSPHIGHO2_02_FULL_48_21]OGD02080.1 MAG: hypothetical protein A2354_02855 [Candidatus Amesbacteria bacte
MSTQLLISVVIVNWNVADSLVRCLNSVFAADYPNLEVIVIDNASQDTSVKLVKTRFPKAKLIINSKNLGFPKAVNQGLAAAKGDYLLVTNPDVKLPENFFNQALSFAKSHPLLGILGPKFLDPDGTPQGSVFPEPSVVNTFREYWLGQTGLTQKYTPQTSVPLPVNAVSGACMFLPKSTITRIGKFTECIFMYYEDLDYCRRVRAASLEVIFHPGITVIHEHGRSTEKSNQEKYRNFVESVIYPFRKLVKNPNQAQSVERFRTESGIWYNGWLKNTLITGTIWTSQKWRAIFHR